MTSRRIARTLAALALTLLAAAAAGCTLVTTPQATGNLAVTIEVQRFLQGNSHIVVHFATPDGNTVEFVSGETVACDGQFLRYSLGSYIGDVPRQVDDGTYTVTYTPAANGAAGAGTAGSPVTVAVAVVPAAVSVSQPAAGATVPRNAPLTIQYNASGLASTSINVVATDGRANFNWTWPQGDTGTMSVPQDKFASFQAGPGLLTVTRETDSYPSGTPFNRVDVHFKNITQVPIVWS
jgi:hypothetical protein